MRLKELYKKIPKIECPQGCNDCCSPVAMLRSEALAMGIKGRKRTNWDENNVCEFATPEGCTEYDNRPFACRFFGAMATGGFSCKKVISGNTLSINDGAILLKEYAFLMEESNSLPDEDFMIATAMHDQAKHKEGLLEAIKVERSPTGLDIVVKNRIGS